MEDIERYMIQTERAWKFGIRIASLASREQTCTYSPEAIKTEFIISCIVDPSFQCCVDHLLLQLSS